MVTGRQFGGTSFLCAATVYVLIQSSNDEPEEQLSAGPAHFELNTGAFIPAVGLLLSPPLLLPPPPLLQPLTLLLPPRLLFQPLPLPLPLLLSPTLLG